MSKRYRRNSPRYAQANTYTLNFGDISDEATGYRQTRLEHLLLNELQFLIRDEATDRFLEGITVLAVDLSPDGGHARAAYAIKAPLDREQELARTSKAGLIRATGFLRARLAQQLNLKKLPKLTFAFVGLIQEEISRPIVPGGESCPE